MTMITGILQIYINIDIYRKNTNVCREKGIYLVRKIYMTDYWQN
jgi:hypothetical protein